MTATTASSARRTLAEIMKKRENSSPYYHDLLQMVPYHRIVNASEKREDTQHLCSHRISSPYPFYGHSMALLVVLHFLKLESWWETVSSVLVHEPLEVLEDLQTWPRVLKEGRRVLKLKPGY
jgi:hypothetical protein